MLIIFWFLYNFFVSALLKLKQMQLPSVTKMVVRSIICGADTPKVKKRKVKVSVMEFLSINFFYYSLFCYLCIKDIGHYQNHYIFNIFINIIKYFILFV